MRRDHLAGLGDGVGFALGTELVCLDLDGCVSPQGVLHDHAAALLAAVDGYAEYSPAGGLHVLAHAHPALPANSQRAGRVELLRRGLVTVTGAALPGRILEPARGEDVAAVWARMAAPVPPPLSPPHATAGSLDVDRLLRAAAALRNADRFFALWRGEVDHHPSPSEADFSLCRHLHFLLGPQPDAIDAAFRASGLYRRRADNWHRCAHRGPPPLSYGQLTVRCAIACGGPTLSRPGGPS
ncbi:hypothetical protein [Deinococcus yunweiensis]|uniref:phage NrS-1 polymerase family protein n=1 Tax=Deinococcus yunweiensis TaxID=367282 RepID=UPI00398F23B6